MPISTGKPTCQERSARTVGWRGFGKVLVARHDALASAHARARSKNYGFCMRAGAKRKRWHIRPHAINWGRPRRRVGGAMPPPGSPSGLGHVMSRWTTGSRTASLVPTTISSTTAARDGTSSSISPGGSCPSITPMGAWVLINGTWYKAFQGLAPARRASPGPPTVRPPPRW
jgi:hypothetical protein